MVVRAVRGAGDGGDVFGDAVGLNLEASVDVVEALGACACVCVRACACVRVFVCAHARVIERGVRDGPLGRAAHGDPRRRGVCPGEPFRTCASKPCIYPGEPLRTYAYKPCMPG